MCVKFPPAHPETNPFMSLALTSHFTAFTSRTGASLRSRSARPMFGADRTTPVRRGSWTQVPGRWKVTRTGEGGRERLADPIERHWTGMRCTGRCPRAHAGLAQPGGRKWTTEVQAVDGDDPNRSKTFHASEGDMPTETSETAKASEEATCLTCPCTKSIHSADCCWICSKDCWSIGKLSGPLLVLGWRPSRSSCRSGLGSARGSEAEEQKKEPGNPLTEPMLK